MEPIGSGGTVSYLQWWDNEATADTRYATLAWGGDGTPEQVGPTMKAELDNISLVLQGIQRNLGRNDLVVMEFGCGPGRLLRRLAIAHPDVDFVGVDVSQAMLDLGGAWPDNAETVTVDADEPDLSIFGKVDFIYSVEVFQHLTYRQVRHALTAMKLALAEHGHARILFQYVAGTDGGIIMCHPMNRIAVDVALDGAWLTPTQCDGLNKVHDEWEWVLAKCL